MHEGIRSVHASVEMPEMAVHARGKDCEDDELEILKHGVVLVLKEQRRDDIHRREQYTTSVVENVMLHQDGIQMTPGRPPALYGAYDREAHESKLKQK